MTSRLKRGLWLWAGALALALLMIIPLSVWGRAGAMLAVMVGVVLAWKRIGQRTLHQRESLIVAGNLALPKASYRQPVMLMCGDGLVGLFGAIPAEQLALRITGQGCYLRVPSLEHLTAVTDSLMALRPNWGRQLSVMLVINPQEHADNEVLAGRIRAFRHQLMRVRKRGFAFPLLVLNYLHVARGEGPWFSWEEGHTSPSVREQGACVSLSDWQRQGVEGATQAARLQTSVQVSSAAAWLAETVLAHLTSRDVRTPVGLPMVCAIALVPAVPRSVAGNLWQQWLRDKTALAGSRHETAAGLPFPDPLLSLLPSATCYSPTRRAGVVAIWLFATASLIALVNSAWQNTLLVRQVSDDLRRYAAIATGERRDDPLFTAREDAVQVLRQHASRLDNYYRKGALLSLGLGLYRGEHLRAHLLAVIAAHRQPPMAMATTVRLDSLSLFSTGSAELKPDSAKILIKALVGIKAQPGWLIVIAGHTDASGSPEQNLQLSRARAAAVQHWMRQMGDIPDSCFAVQGFGASQPIASNATEAGRQANRRVDIRLIPDAEACVLPTADSGQQPQSHYAAFTI